MTVLTPPTAAPAVDEAALRVDLAAAFRIAVRMGWHESVGNHFSVAVSGDGRRFLLNPRWRHFATIRAGDLLVVDAGDEATMDRPDAPDPSAWCLHGALHTACPQSRVILHCHPPFATALCGLADPSILPIDQNTARFFERVALDLAFGGMADEAAEGARIARLLGDRSILVMRNHGVTVTGPTVAYAFEELYFLEKAARTLMLAYASGRPLQVLPDDIARKTRDAWAAYAGAADAHFAYWKQELDRTEPDYSD